MRRAREILYVGLVLSFFSASVYAVDFTVKVKTNKDVYIQAEPIEIQLIVENRGLDLKVASLCYPAVVGIYAPGAYDYVIYSFPRDAETSIGSVKGPFRHITDSIPSKSEMTVGIVVDPENRWLQPDSVGIEFNPDGESIYPSPPYTLPLPIGLYEVVGRAKFEYTTTIVDGRERSVLVGGQGSTVIKIVSAQPEPILEQLKMLGEGVDKLQSAVSEGNIFLKQLSGTLKALWDLTWQIYNQVIANNRMLQKLIQKFKL